MATFGTATCAISKLPIIPGSLCIIVPIKLEYNEANKFNEIIPHYKISDLPIEKIYEDNLLYDLYEGNFMILHKEFYEGILRVCEFEDTWPERILKELWQKIMQLKNKVDQITTIESLKEHENFDKTKFKNAGYPISKDEIEKIKTDWLSYEPIRRLSAILAETKTPIYPSDYLQVDQVQWWRKFEEVRKSIVLPEIHEDQG